MTFLESMISKERRSDAVFKPYEKTESIWEIFCAPYFALLNVYQRGFGEKGKNGDWRKKGERQAALPVFVNIFIELVDKGVRIEGNTWHKANRSDEKRGRRRE